ncbi:hypothetical protein K9B33_18730 [Sphingobium sp. 3R8]|uniref:hypothetical protein n=1 Tax=Sphingobium sp. 3R8 TaxID=2874921 RepID=UPI001CCE1815|nr:hypothetical protein [Sphingobium sp. 3R8]MBZ9649576.1 hypothetical protein [Sphingobium sp. 3R8]
MQRNAPTLDQVLSWLVPLVRMLEATDGQSVTHYYRTIRQSIALAAVDEPTPRPKKVTELYRLREQQLAERLEETLGAEWRVATGDERAKFVNDRENVLIAPEATLLLFDEEDGQIKPGIAKRSGSTFNFYMVAKRFPDSAAKLAYMICK